MIRGLSENIPMYSLCISPKNKTVSHPVHTWGGGRVMYVIHRLPVFSSCSQDSKPNPPENRKTSHSVPSQVADEGGAVLSVYLSWSRYACWGCKNQYKFKHDCSGMLWGSRSRPASFRKQKAEVSEHAGHTCKYRCRRVSRPPCLRGWKHRRRMTTVYREVWCGGKLK